MREIRKKTLKINDNNDNEEEEETVLNAFKPV